jgi:mycofactocin precursor
MSADLHTTAEASVDQAATPSGTAMPQRDMFEGVDTQESTPPVLTPGAELGTGDVAESDVLVEDVSIDGMCGVY